MNFSLKIFFIFLFFYGSLIFYPKAAAENNLKKLLSDSSNSQVTFYATELSNADNIIEQAAEQVLLPASLTKILTSYYALKNYGGNYTFETEFFLVQQDGPRQNLLVRASGAPDLVIEDLFLIVRRLKQLGVVNINQLIVESPSNYDEPLIGPDAYQAQTSALPINYNAIGVEICSAAQAGQAARIVTDLPELPQVVTGQILTVAAAAQVKPLLVDLKYQPASSNWQFALSGAVLQGAEQCQTIYRALPEARLALAPVLVNLLRSQGVQVGEDKTIVNFSEPLAAPIFVHKSRALAEIIYRMNRYSSNLISKQLAFRYAQEKQANSFAAGVLAVQDYFKQNFLAAQSLKLLDTSGLDRANRISPKLLVEVLRAAAKDQRITIELQNSLVRPGEGTMRNRKFRGVDSLRAKTGYINGVSGLSGYLTTSSGRSWAFAIMQNNVLDRERAMEFEELIIDRFYKDF